jgi:hypothetical protein
MAAWWYRCAGLDIESGLRLPEWQVFELPQAPAQIDVRILLDHGQIAEVLSTAEASSSAWIGRDEFRFSLPEAGAFRVRRGCEIAVHPAPGADEKVLRSYLLGTAWAALCCQRGLLALHASVVQVGDGAAAFCGPSGAGKSSLAALLAQRGFPLAGDDLVCVDFVDGQPRLHPSAPRLKLWRQTLDELGWSAAGLPGDPTSPGKFHTAPEILPHIPALEPLPLAAVYLLEWGEPGLQRLRGLDGLRRFIPAAAYRPSLLAAMGQEGAYWQQCAALARRAPIFRFSRPRDWAAAGASLELLLQCWQRQP